VRGGGGGGGGSTGEVEREGGDPVILRFLHSQKPATLDPLSLRLKRGSELQDRSCVLMPRSVISAEE